jgi:hypothetical protein
MRISDLAKRLREFHKIAGGNAEVYFITPDGTLHSIDNVKLTEGNTHGPRVICSADED